MDRRVEKKAEGAEEPLRKRTVLVVDDHEAMQELLHAVLEMRGYGFRGARSVDEALAIAREGGVDAVIADWTLPQGGGERLARELATDGRTRHIPVIVTTGAHLPDVTPFPNVAAALPKPFDLDVFCLTLEEHC
ncbi:MAG: response regulator [Clostridia bacterium]|nr:response regulator [Clostridia bacterium]